MGVSMCKRTNPFQRWRSHLLTFESGGDRVTDKIEQDALLEILIRTEEIHSLSTGKAQKELREAWDWDFI
jgi:hypothetical protein